MSRLVSSSGLFGFYLVVSAVTGLFASLALSIEKIEKLANPQTSLGCDFSVLVQCSTNLDSPQGAVFGFPNPFLGLIGFTLVLGVGVGVWAVPHFARWFWVTFNAGVAVAFVFVLWLIGQSIYVLGTLCPWCMAVWVTTTPLFLFVTTWNLRAGVYGVSLKRVGAAIWPWMTLVSLSAVVFIAVLAQLRLDVLASLF